MKEIIDGNIPAENNPVDKEKRYWLNKLSGQLEKSHFPYDRIQTGPGQPGTGSGKAYVETGIPGGLFRQLSRVTNNSDKNIYVVLLAMAALLLARYSGNNDVSAAVPIYKQHKEGEFVNTLLVIRNRLEQTRALTVKELLVQVKKNLAEANQNLNYPVQRLLYHLGMPVPPSNDFPLTGTAVLLENIHHKKYLDPFNFELVFSFLRTGDGLEGTLEYNPRLYRKETAARICGHFILLLGESLKDIHRRIRDIDWLTGNERRLLFRLNRTRREYPRHKTICELFEDQAARGGDRIAVIGGPPRAGGGAVTRALLNKKSGGLARRLREKGVNTGTAAGIMAEPSLEMITAIIAVLKAGGTYLPLAPGYPEARLEYMLNDSNTHILLKSGVNTGTLSFFKKEIVNIDGAEVYNHESEANLKPAGGPGDNVYIVYTSGTTGQPKGVPVHNENLVNYVHWFSKETGLTPGDRTVLTSSFIFDLGYTTVYTALLKGCELHMALRETYLDAENFLNYLETAAITYLKMTPSLFNVIVNSSFFKPGKLQTLRLLVSGGEAVNLADIEVLHSRCPHVRVMNHYGPTEATIGSIARFIDFSRFARYRETPFIGRPTANTAVFIMDKNLNPLPMGVPGEICLAGAGVAAGYLNRPGLTAEKFIQKLLPKGPPGGRGQIIYKTGDLGRWWSNDGGNIEFLGRIDHQVKIRGYRIELAEIEQQLTGFSGVRESVAVVLEDEKIAGGKQLAAYIVPDPGYAAPVCRLLSLEQSGPPASTSIGIGGQRYLLPNGMPVFHLNKNETDHMYREIIEARSYMKPGIFPAPGAAAPCIFDVGANIGIFSLFVHRRYPDAVIYAFEPIPSVYEILKLNTYLYGLKGKVFNLGISSAGGEASFTYYPNISILSGRYADAGDESKAVRNYIYQQRLSGETGYDDGLSGDQVQELLEDRLAGETVSCALKSLSQVIEENGVGRIDLLKIVVEKSELDVLRGIEEKDWPKIGRLVVEVHNKDGRLAEIEAMLTKQGFYITVDRDGSVVDSDFYYIYAVRQKAAAAGVGEGGQAARRCWYSPERLVSDLEAHLKSRLPDYMVPGYIVPMAALPLTPNGKLDRGALPLPGTGAGKEYIPPRDKVEEKLQEIWWEVLGTAGDNGPAIGIDDDFFQLGGNSLSVVTMVSKIHKELNVKIPLAEIFKTPTIMELSAFIEKLPGYEDRYASVEPVEKKEYYPLSSAQKRMFTLQQLDPAGTAYNMPQVVPLADDHGVDMVKLEETLKKMIRHHESLRTSFHILEDHQVQRIRDNARFKIEYYDLTDSRGAAVDTGTLVKNSFIRPFDLSKVPLLRLGVVKTAAGGHLLLTDRHHIISDGVSIGLLMGDIMTLYRDEELSPLRIQYKDFSQWQNSEKEKGALKKQEIYWTRQFEDGVPELNLPIDYPRPAARSFEGDIIHFEIPGQDVGMLRTIAAEEKASVFMVLSALFNILLAKLAGREDIVIGTVVAGRRHVDLEKIIGMFVNTLAIRNYPGREKTFKQFLREVKERTLEALENQDYQFEDLVEQISVNRDAGRNPVFDAMFSFFEIGGKRGESPGQKRPGSNRQKETYENIMQTAKFDLTLNGTETPALLLLSFEYCTKLFKRETIETFISYFKEIVSSVIKNPTAGIGEIEMVSEEEGRRVLKAIKDNEADGFIKNIGKNQGGPGPSGPLEAEFDL